MSEKIRTFTEIKMEKKSLDNKRRSGRENKTLTTNFSLIPIFNYILKLKIPSYLAWIEQWLSNTHTQ